MSATITFELSEKHFGIFYPYLVQDSVTDIDYNGRNIWITDLEKGRYPAPESVSERFVMQFTHDIANCMNRPFNQANQVLEADTNELRISIVHESAAVSRDQYLYPEISAGRAKYRRGAVGKRLCESAGFKPVSELCPREDEFCVWRDTGSGKDGMREIFYAVYPAG